MRHLLILPTAAAVFLTAAAPAALAADSTIVHRQSVLTEVDASGSQGTSRVFTQMTVPSGQEVSLAGQATKALRSLTGTASREGDNVVFGGGLTRTVADHTADLPVSLDVTYTTDGQTVDPRDVVGHDGEVAVTYVVSNLTSEPTEVTVTDGDRVGSRQTVDVAVPLVGSLSMTLPPVFSDIQAPGAVVVGDGRGNTVITWSLLLFSPLGSETQEVTWTANARDAIVPEALLQIVPVSPASFGSFDATADAYEGAVGSTRELTAGAREIDLNLKRLAEGAGKLLDGLTQLADGSAQLAEGLVAARDGSGQLSDGLGQARDGGEQLSSGLGELSDGASRIAVGLAALDAGAATLGGGLGQLADGSAQLASGVGQLSDGATLLDSKAQELAAGSGQLATGAGDLQAGINLLAEGLTGPDGLPKALAGIDQLQAGIGSSTTPGATILYGLTLVGAGLESAQAGIGAPPAPGTLRNGVARVQGGLSNPLCNPADPANPANPCGVSQLNSSVGSLGVAIQADLLNANTKLGEITGPLSVDDQAAVDAAMTSVTTAANRTSAIQALSGGIATVVTQLQGGLTLVDGGLADLSAGIGDPTTANTLRNGVFRITTGVSNPLCDLTNPSDPANPCGLLQGLELLEAGLSEAATEVAAGLGDATTENTLLWGAAQVAGGSALVADGAGRLQAEGTAPIAAGAAQASDGADQLAAGAAKADGGADQLIDGAGQLADGSVQLADGAERAASGSSDLADGLVQLDDGGQQLADGLVDAADGSQQLADGLGRAEPGGAFIAEGAQRLTDEGTSVLARSVSDASASSSLQLAHVRAVAARGTDGDGLPYPTVEGADASAVYKFELAGIGADAGPGVAGRIGLGALALLAAALLGSAAGGRLGRREEFAEV